MLSFLRSRLNERSTWHDLIAAGVAAIATAAGLPPVWGALFVILSLGRALVPDSAK